MGIENYTNRQLAVPAFSVLLRRFRRSAGLTQTQLAHRANFSTDYIRRLELDGRHPTLATVDLLALALGLTGKERDLLQAAAGGSKGRPQDASAGTPPPTFDTSFVGRGSERAELEALIQGGVRSILITGPPGVGKTRLALAVAGELGGGFGYRVAFYRFDAASEARIGGLWIPFFAGVDDAEPALIILDSLELVPSLSAAWSRLVRGLPRGVLLGTSRARLHLTGACEYQLAPFSVPENRSIESETLSDSKPLVLFADRARAVNPMFPMSPRNRALVVALCREREGLPALIESVAGRAAQEQAMLEAGNVDGGRWERAPQVPTPPSMSARAGSAAEELDRRLFARLRLDNQLDVEGMEASLGPQLDRLAAPEQELFERLAVFSGGWSTTAAADICGPELEGVDVSELIWSLVDQSLIVEAGEGRFRFLKPIHICAERRLQRSLHEAHLRVRHAEFFASLAASLPGEPVDMSQNGLAEIELEEDNMLQALTWSFGHDEPGLGGAIVEGMAPWWYARGNLDAAAHWLHRLLESDVQQGGVADGLLELACTVAWERFDLSWLEELLSRRRAGGEHEHQLRDVQLWEAWLSLKRGKLEAVRQRLREDSLHSSREQSVAQHLEWLLIAAHLDRALGRRPEAERLFREAVATADHFARDEIWARARLYVGQSLLLWDRPDEAADVFRQLVASDNVPVRLLAEVVEGMASALASSSDDRALAATLLGAADAMRRARGCTRRPESPDLFVAEAESVLFGHGDAFRRGQALTSEQALALVREQAGG